MAYAIMRIQKHKSCSSLAGADRHGKNRNRLKTLSFPERSKENKIYKKYPDLTLVKSWKKETEGMKIRKNGVYALEVVLTFSPEMRYDIEARQDEWINANMNWLSANFHKDNITMARVEYDESNLHIHAFITPKINNKLCAKHFIGDKFKLTALQTSYAEAMSKFGLERGKCYADCPNEKKPRHKTLKEYYYEIENSRGSSDDVIIDMHRKLKAREQGR